MKRRIMVSVLGAWDEDLFRWINAGWSSPWLDSLFWFFSLGIKTWWLRAFLGALLVGYLLLSHLFRSAALQAMIAWPIANEFSDVFKIVLPSSRPCVDFSEVNLLGPLLTSSGTMSAHSATMAAVATVMVLRTRWWGIPWILVAFMTGLSRIYVGVHYPSQVLLGWMGGIVCGWIVVASWDAYVRLRKNKLLRQSENN